MKLYESMTKMNVGRYTVRVWCATPQLSFGPSELVRLRLERLTGTDPTVLEIAELLDATADVSAYEILDRHGDGVVVYAEWP